MTAIRFVCRPLGTDVRDEFRDVLMTAVEIDAVRHAEARPLEQGHELPVAPAEQQVLLDQALGHVIAVALGEADADQLVRVVELKLFHDPPLTLTRSPARKRFIRSFSWLGVKPLRTGSHTPLPSGPPPPPLSVFNSGSLGPVVVARFAA